MHNCAFIMSNINFQARIVDRNCDTSTVFVIINVHEDAPSIEQICSRADKALFALVDHNPDHVLSHL